MSKQDHPQDLARRLSSLSPEQRALLALRLKKKGGEFNSFPLSFAQERLWFLDQLEPGNSAYNVPAALRLTGRIEVEALERTLREVVRRHEVLRTSFAVIDGKPVQTVMPHAAARLAVTDLGPLPGDEREREARRLAEAEARKPFDLARGPLLRARLLRLADAEHVLLFTMHHIVSDGWSMSVLVGEVAALYAAYVRGEESPLPELSIQYADFAVWQRRHLTGEVLERQLSYWRERLAGAPPVLELPTDRPRPAVQTFNGAKYLFDVPAELTEELRALSRREGVTLYMLLLAAFQTLLMRYSGQEDVVVGSPIANRNRAETEPLIGFFVNTLVMRTDLSGDPTFVELLGRVKDVALGAYAHQDVPFEKLVEELQPERNAAHTPIFQVMFALQNAPQASFTLPGLTLSALGTENHTTHFDLGVSLGEGSEGLYGVVEYNTDLFDRETIAQLMRHLRRLLASAAQAPHLPVTSLPLLDEDERRLLLDEWGHGADSFDTSTTAHQLFEAQAAASPEAVALVLGGDRLTYGELNARANRLARYLLRLGVGAGSRVGICVERSFDMVVGLLGIMKAGCAYVPLDPDYPSERLAFMLEDAQARVLLTHTRLEASLPAGGATRVLLDADAPLIAAEAGDDLPPRAAPSDLAYLIYTSGTTGRPKAVMVEHRQLVNTLLSARSEFGFGAGDVMAVEASYSFDIWLFETLSPLLAGGRAVLLRREEVLDVGGLVGRLGDEGATLLHAVPSLMRQVVEHLRSAGAGWAPPEAINTGSAPRLPGLRMVFVGGDAVSPDLLTAMREVFPGAALRVLYGPTEATIICTAYAADGVRQAGARQMIGRPLPNVRLRVADARGEPTPVGVAGEIYIGGAGVSRGYHGREELTREKFVLVGGERYYRSGDVGRWRRGGELEFVGRADGQVKVRGFRVELGEVEAVLAEHEAVREVAVAAAAGAGGERRLVAYVALRGAEGAGGAGGVGAGDAEGSGRGAQAGGAEGDRGAGDGGDWVGELRAYARGRLPEYMVPSQWVGVGVLPLTAQGKVDRGRLPDAGEAASAAESGREYEAPRGEVEEVIAGIWGEVLGVGRVGAHDNFFELGGDSILSIQVVARARQAGLHLTPKKLFQHQTVAELAAAVGEGEPGAEAEQGIVTGPLPLTPVQRRFLEEQGGNPHHFNMAVLLEAGEVLQAGRVRRVVEKLLEHHDALRLRLRQEGGRWRQFIDGPAEDTPFEYFDLSQLAEGERAAAVERETARLQRSLNLSAGPLLRVALFHAGPALPDRLFIVVHHFAFDGVSWRILLEDFQTAYAQLGRGEEIGLPAKTASFKTWAEALGAHAGSQAVRSQLPYWTEARRGLARPLPLDHTGGANTETSARVVTVTLDREETRALLQKAPAAYRTQIGDVLLTALAQAFARWTGGPALLVELEGHGRDALGEDLDVSRTVGWFTSLYPVLLELEEGAGPGEALKSIKEQLRGVPAGGAGYGLLRYAGGDEPAAETLRALPRPEVVFNYHGQLDQALAGGVAFRPAPESAGPARDAGGHRTHALGVNGLVAGERLRLDWTYSENLHRRETVEGLAAGYVAALRALIAHCLSEEAGGVTPSDFPLARIGQRQLDKLAGRGRDLEDIYRLSPMQQGLLFHTLHHPGSGLYVLQVSCTLGGGFDVQAFKRAWRGVIENNPTLRTAILWRGLDEPLQVVYARAELPWRQEDWRDVPAEERRARLARVLDEELRQDIELSRAPLMRLALRRLADDEYHLVWSFHHILLDGWSLALLMGQVFKAYAACLRGEEPPAETARPYRDYIAWLEGKDLSKAEEFWRRELAGFRAPTPLGAAAGGVGERPAARAEGYDQRELKLAAETTRRLQSLAQQHQLTLNTVVQGAWALLLGRYGRGDDVVFGVVVSGRPAELPGVEKMLGIFINALPLRARVDGRLQLVPWLKSLQERNVELRQYEYSPLVEVQRWSEVPAGLPLFESVFVFENYPLDETLPEMGGDLGIRDAHFSSQNNYPLTVHAHPRGAELVLQFIYQQRRFEGARVEQMLDDLAALLARIVARPGASLSELAGTSPADEKERNVMEAPTRGRAGFRKVKGVRPKAISLDSAALVRTSTLGPGRPLPLVVEPQVAGVDAADWARNNLDYVNGQLLGHGAILFRGFGFDAAEHFERFVQAITPELFTENGEHPRRSISGNVYTPVSYPPEKQLLWHNENSFNHQWPTKIWFGCARPADAGGETPLVDSRRVFQMLDPGIRRRFVEKQVMYVRNYEEGLGLNWQTVLRTSDKAEAEAICRRNLMEFEWKDRGRLRTRSVRPAAVRHPASGDWVWFNQAQHWHVSCLDPAARDLVRNNFREEDYPRNCYYGDGTPIEDSVMAEILDVYRQLESVFPWQEGDALVLDNLLTAHGRNPYAGERRLFVAMGEMKSYDEVETAAGLEGLFGADGGGGA